MIVLLDLLSRQQLLQLGLLRVPRHAEAAIHLRLVGCVAAHKPLDLFVQAVLLGLGLLGLLLVVLGSSGYSLGPRSLQVGAYHRCSWAVDASVGVQVEENRQHDKKKEKQRERK